MWDGVAISLVRVSLSLPDCHPHTTNLFNISAPRGVGSLQMFSYKLRDIEIGSVELFARASILFRCVGCGMENIFVALWHCAREQFSIR